MRRKLIFAVIALSTIISLFCMIAPLDFHFADGGRGGEIIAKLDLCKSMIKYHNQTVGFIMPAAVHISIFLEKSPLIVTIDIPYDFNTVNDLERPPRTDLS